MAYARLFVLVGMMLLAGGCGPAAFVTQAVFPEKAEAQYKPPKTPMLVLVENRQNPEMAVSEAEQLTGYIIDELVANEVCPVVETKVLQKLRDTRKDMHKLTISQIGKAAGASQVLYVDLQRANVGSIEGMPTQGRLDVRVHVVDVASAKTVFPSTAEAVPMTFETPMMTASATQNPGDVREALLRSAAISVGRLFYDYVPGGY